MTSESSRLPYVCQKCLCHLHRRPRALQPRRYTSWWPKPSSIPATPSIRFLSDTLRPKEWHRGAKLTQFNEAVAFRKLLAWKQMCNGGSPLTSEEINKLRVTYGVENGKKLREFYKNISKMQRKMKIKIPPPLEGSTRFEPRRIRKKDNELPERPTDTFETPFKIHKHKTYDFKIPKSETFTFKERRKFAIARRVIYDPSGTISPSKPFQQTRRVMTIPPRSPAFSTMVKVDTNVGYSWYWETTAPSVVQKAQAHTFFTQQAPPKFLTSVAQFRTFPMSDLPEVAFVGRSNVGKSSLLNTLVNSKLLARTSATRGFTKTMNLYGVAPKGNINLLKNDAGHEKITGAGGLTIVDMPGYGDGSLSEWGKEIMKYIQDRKQLRRVFVLIDALHGIKEKDQFLLTKLRLGGIPHQIILSKLDRVYIPAGKKELKTRDGRKLKPKGSPQDVMLTMAAIREQIQPHGVGAVGELLGISSEVLVDGKGLGVDAVRFAVLQAAGITLGAKGTKIKEDLVRAVVTDTPQRHT